jgi:hypothetical protein
MTSGKRLLLAVVLALAVLAPRDVMGAVPRRASAAPATNRTSLNVAPARARGWEAVEQASGVDIAAQARRLGVPVGGTSQLPALPWAVANAVTNLAAGRGLAAGDATTAAVEPERAQLSHELTGDVTGDGRNDLWLVNSLTGRPDVASVVDAATGAQLWRAQGRWSSIAPVVVGDVDGDGVWDVAATISEFLDVTQTDDFEGEDRQSSIDVRYRTGVAVLSGASGARLWESTDTESFGLSLYGRYTTTEYLFGIRVRLTNALLAPELLDRAGGAQLVVQRVDEDGLAETGGHGAFVWSQDPALDGVRATDTARVAFTGGTRADIVDAVDGRSRQTFTQPGGDGVGFLVPSAGPGQRHGDMLWVTLTLPEQRMECVELACLETPAANRSMTVEAYGPDGTQRWQRGWAGRYDTGLHAGRDLNGDGAADVLLEEVVPAGDSFEVQVASVDGPTGADRWRRSLGATSSKVLSVIGPDSRPVIAAYELREADRSLSLTLHRLDGRTGLAGTPTTHDIQFPPQPDDPLGLFGDPYVASTISQVWLDVADDMDGDGVEELLVSLAQRRGWSDGRADTYWGRWAVESGATGSVLHALQHAQPARITAAWADTSGDSSSEFIEYTTSPRSIIEHDGATGAALHALGDHLSPLADITGDGATDLLSVVVDGQGGHVVAALDGKDHRTLWELAVPRDQ